MIGGNLLVGKGAVVRLAGGVGGDTVNRGGSFITGA
jgi:hypothetical protein